MRIPRILIFILLFVSCSCSTVRQQLLEQEAGMRRNMQDETIRLEVALSVISHSLLNQFKIELGLPIDPSLPMESRVVTMSCSGVVIEHTGGFVLKPESTIATAHHCLDVRLGGKISDGSVITAILITAQDSHGRTCGVRTLRLGGYGPDDVAIARADCHLGKAARLAEAVPQRQEQIYVSGHPSGVYPGLVTTGFMSGWLNGWILLSAPAWGGNSGGPVFNTEGEVIGLLVRGSREYPHITLAAPLGELQARIKSAVF